VFGNVPPTPYDLRFRLFGFPVRVNPWFWLITALLGSSALQREENGLLCLLLWIAVVFVSILVHELGHAFAARFYGSPCEILLYALGGLAIPQSAPARGWRRIAISLAGPAAGFALGAVVFLTDLAANWSGASDLAGVAYWYLIVVTLFWNVVNLLPIWPLDGGQVCHEALYLAKVKQPDVATFKVSIVTSGAVAALILAANFGMLPPRVARAIPVGLFTALWFVVFAFENYQLLQAAIRNRNTQTW
jgi:membrane-associated protease RseP (regulator of RpoE activity)